MAAHEGRELVISVLMLLLMGSVCMVLLQFDLVQVDFETWRRMQGENALENAESSSNNSDAENSEHDG